MSKRRLRNMCPALKRRIPENATWTWTQRRRARKKDEGDHGWNAFVSSDEILASRDPSCRATTTSHHSLSPALFFFYVILSIWCSRVS